MNLKENNSMKHEYCAEYNNVLLRPFHRYDIEQFRQWRNSQELNKYLSPISFITKEMQEKWYKQYIEDTNILFFTVDYNRIRAVGSIALYDFQNDHCQIGKIVIGEPAMRGKGLGYQAFLLAISIGIYKLGICQFYLSVHEKNEPALHLYKKIGFQQLGMHLSQNGGNEWEMLLKKNDFESLNTQRENVLIYGENESI